MRANEFLINESALSTSSPPSWGKYLRALLQIDSISLGDKGELAQDLQLTDNSKEIIANLADEFDASDDKYAMKPIISRTKIEYTDGTTSAIGKIYKSPVIKSVSNQFSTEAKKYWNEGEVAETFLGAALFARFQSIENIDSNDVIDAMRRFKEIEGGFSFTGHRNNDPIEMIALNKPDNNKVVLEYINNYPDFSKKFAKGVKGLNSTLAACVSYVNNSPKIKTAIDRADSNDDSDRIIIKTDGVSDQKGTKADLQLKIGNLETLLSLKVNAVKQFGQNTGATAEIVTKFFNTFIPGIDLSSLAQNWPDMSRKGTNILKRDGTLVQTFQTVYALIGQAYTAADNELNARLTDPVSVAHVVNSVHDGILHYIQGSAVGQTVVILNPKAGKDWQELDFNNDLIGALKSFRIESSVSVANVNGENNHILRIYGRPLDSIAAAAMSIEINTDADAEKAVAVARKASPKKVDPELLIQLRSYLQTAGPTIRNIIEMGPLLKDIADVEKIKDVIATSPKIAEPVAPVADEPDELEKIKSLAGIKPKKIPKAPLSPAWDNPYQVKKPVKAPLSPAWSNPYSSTAKNRIASQDDDV